MPYQFPQHRAPTPRGRWLSFWMKVWTNRWRIVGFITALLIGSAVAYAVWLSAQPVPE